MASKLYLKGEYPMDGEWVDWVIGVGESLSWLFCGAFVGVVVGGVCAGSLLVLLEESGYEEDRLCNKSRFGKVRFLSVVLPMLFVVPIAGAFTVLYQLGAPVDTGAGVVMSVVIFGVLIFREFFL
jgi:hypothetical protein